ncbi:DUF3995 domain-containing protein [Arthrobacter sp. zg-Y820]|uniref:DUF3995 domain-containing protein n=1 Tax=unclassified Arthrobacter TaxID=235627 RepID=UPI0025417711|nr:MULTISPECIES: DUF3995 domain-containing protein [unclassified Arthrobacter]MCC9196714.1 DUF3995 domain-containing protein [Arthrobacter sp. zg-Y820]MDK1279576.1 DUF3995 domain-containing protein [Arthrobacter sp. zg.Y820]WIB08051.1 DUF3995 domain-containing protein [Arthrobacter sp. zg-Y820]
MEPSHHQRLSRTFVWVACAAGAVHAAFSLYWAVGGRWLLATVGAWAVEHATQAPLEAGLVLGAIGTAKLLAAAIPPAVIYGQLPWQRFWRALSWIGGIFLTIYGAANTVTGAAVLAGAIRPAGGYDAAAMVGHAWLWDPLFLVWGAALCLALWFSRKEPQSLP